MIRALVIVLAATSLSGCYSMQGSERVLNRDGQLTNEVVSNSVFRADFQRVFAKRQAGPVVPQAEVDAMLASGFTHIYSFCDNYFDSMALQQRKSRVARDSIAPITALITGVLALHSFDNGTKSKEDILAAIGLTTAATSSALSIYDEHMLFGAENIASVETLTLNALGEHSSRVQEFSNVSFDTAVKHLLKNQSICSPQHILTLTREAIKEGRVSAHTSEDSVVAGVRTPGSDSNKTVDVTIQNN